MAISDAYVDALVSLFNVEEVFDIPFPSGENTVGDFKTDLSRAQVWEDRVIELVKLRLKEDAPFRDVRDLKLPWDIEFATGNKIIHVDIKADFRSDDTGNLAGELYHEYPDGKQKKGWLSAAGLDQVLMIQPMQCKVHRCLRAAWQVIAENPPTGIKVNRRKHENPGFTTWVVAMSVDDMKKAGIIKDTWDIPND